MRCFVYCRVSTEEQDRDNHYSLRYQEESARHRIKEKGWQLYRVRQDVGSGKATEHREGYLELLEAIQDKRIDGIIVYKLDRLSRNVRDVYDILNLTEEHGVEFISLTEGFDTTTPMGRAMLGIAAVFAQLTRETIAENVKSGLVQRAKSGQWCGGGIPPGYDYSPDTGLTVNDEEAQLVRRVFDLYTNNKLGINRLALHLNQQGILSPTGTQWTAARITRLLQNPVYIGRMRYDNRVSEGRHEAIISQEQFDSTKELIESRQTFAPRTRHAGLLLAGLARCGYCGGRLASHPKSGDKPRYRCYGNVKVGEGGCGGFVKVADLVDEPVIEKIRLLAQSELLQAMAVEEAKKMLATTIEPSREERGHLLVELGRIAEDFTRWATRLDRGRIDEEQFDQHNRTLLAKKAKLQVRLQEIEGSLGEYERVEANLEEVKAALRDFDMLWQEGTLEEHKVLVSELVEELRVTRDKVTLKIRFMPEEELELPKRVGRPKQG